MTFGKNFRKFVKYLRRWQESGRPVDAQQLQARVAMLVSKCPYRDAWSRNVIYLFSKAVGRTAATFEDVSEQREFYSICKHMVQTCWTTDQMWLPLTMGFVAGLDAEHLVVRSDFDFLWDSIVPKEDKTEARTQLKPEITSILFEMIPKRRMRQKLRKGDWCYFRTLHL